MSSTNQRRTLALGAALLLGGLLLANAGRDEVVVPERPRLAALQVTPDLTPLEEPATAIRVPALRSVAAPEPADRRPGGIHVPAAPRVRLAVAAPAVEPLAGEAPRIVVPVLLPAGGEITPAGVVLTGRLCAADRPAGATGAMYFVAGS